MATTEECPEDPDPEGKLKFVSDQGNCETMPEGSLPVEDDNCEDFAELETDPRYTIIQIDEDHDPLDCPCCGCNCCGCRGYWTEYSFTVSGISGDCTGNPPTSTDNPCAGNNGSYSMIWQTGCLWITVEDSVCTTEPKYNLSCFNGIWSVKTPCIAGFAVISWSDQLSPNFTCECGGTLTLDPELPCCDTIPGSIEVSPGGSWVNCSQPAPNCAEALTQSWLAERNAVLAASETPAQRAARQSAYGRVKLVQRAQALIGPQAAKVEPSRRGLGDDVERLAHLLGADKLAKLYTSLTGRDCGCNGRKALLNQLPDLATLVGKLGGR